MNWKAIRAYWTVKARLSADDEGESPYLICLDPECDFIHETKVFDENGDVCDSWLTENESGLLICHLCHRIIYVFKYRKPHGEAMQVDHRNPKAHNGEDRLENTSPAHARCNQKKNKDPHARRVSRTLEEWV